MWGLRALVATLCWLLASPERTEFSWHLGHGASFLLQRTNLAPEAPAVPQEAQHGRALHCREGRLELSGDYEVRERLVLQGPCNVSATRAKLRLRAPVVFNGSVALSGSLSVEAKEAAFQEACVSVKGTLLLNAGAFSWAWRGAGQKVQEVKKEQAST
ncbi:unnamed protein product [Symbiodinium natans]|uniref:Uncharacterized protein n=1 Tax=Symbiodinium natans TaxID=878477 RepID=A0A812LZM8_9DINO|nr:unnamed protein product [Symbiodinium natans]